MNKVKKIILKLLLGRNIKIKTFEPTGYFIITDHKGNRVVDEYRRAIFDQINSGSGIGHSEDYVTTMRSHIVSGRRMGNTTRQIDYAIQALFNGKRVGVYSHDKGGRYSDRFLFYAILKRLENEHNLKYLISNGFISIDRSNYVLELDKNFLKHIKKYDEINTRIE